MNNSEPVKDVKQMAEVITAKGSYYVSIPVFKQICGAIEEHGAMVDIDACDSIELFFNKNDPKPFELVLPTNQIVAMRVKPME